MERFEIQEAFTILKPLCDSLMKNPNVNNARSVADAVTGISDRLIQDLLEYILFPIITHLANENVSKCIKEELVKTAKKILGKVKISKIEYFNKIYAHLLIQIYDRSQQNMLIISHEELKEAVLSCIKILIHRCFSEVVELFYTRKNASKIGQGILLSLTIARTEKSYRLRLAAIDTVMALCQIDEETDRSDVILQEQVADVIMFFLPGIVSGLQEIAMGNEIQGHKLTIMALRAWGEVISLVMKDKSEEDPTISPLNALMKVNRDNYNNSLGTILYPKSQSDIEEHLRTTTRNQEWLNASATKLNVLVQELDLLKRHSHYKVRKELVKCIHLLLTTCSRNMKPNVMILIEYLISLSEDHMADVSDDAKKVLDIVNIDYMQNKNMRPLVELLEENFYGVLTKLPRMIRRSDDNEQLSCLNEFAGYLKILGKQRLPHIMLSVPHTRRLLLALVYACEIDCSHISLLQAVNVKDLEDQTYYYKSHLWRRFKFVQNKLCEDKLITICKYLGRFGDLRILVDSILSLISEAPHHKRELILLLNWMTNVSLKDLSFLPLYKEIVEFYINPELWYSEIEASENVSLRVAQNNVVQNCLLTEGLGLIAQNLKENYDRFLLKTLYLIIERAGSGHSLISFVGIQTLEQIAESQHHKTVGDVLRANVDYFSYHVAIKLRRVERNPGVLDVVGVVMKYSTMDVLPCLKEIVEDVLIQLNSNFQKKNSYAFLKVFYTFVTCIKRLINYTNVKAVNKPTEDAVPKSERIIQSVLEYCEAKKIDKKIEAADFDIEGEEETKKNDEEYTNEMNSDVNGEEKSPSIPTYIKMVEELMKHCLHFLPSTEIKKSLIAMSTLQEGLEILAEWEDQLLPIIHLLWHPLVNRFNDKNVLIINRAWQLLNVVGHVSKDFIRSRTLKEVLPALSKFLRDSAKESCNKSSENIYKFTHVFKLQRELLSTLGQTATNLKLRERELWTILSIAEPYLNRNQNPILQTCCIQLFEDVADYNEDIVWAKCLSIWNTKISKIATDKTFGMEDLKIPKDTSTSEYYKNVQIILKHIQDKNAIDT